MRRMRWVLALALPVLAACGSKPNPRTTGPDKPEPSVEPVGNKPTLDPEATMSWSPDKSLIATLTDLKVHLWNGKTKELVRSLDVNRGESVVFSPDGGKLYVAYPKSPPTVHELGGDAGAPRAFALPAGIKPDGQTGSTMLSLSADGAWLLGRCDTNDVCLWDTKTLAGRKWDQPPPGPNVDDEVTSLIFEPGDKRIVVQNAGGSIYRLDPTTMKPFVDAPPPPKPRR